jgi:hypothetical protein
MPPAVASVASTSVARRMRHAVADACQRQPVGELVDVAGEVGWRVEAAMDVALSAGSMDLTSAGVTARRSSPPFASNSVTRAAASKSRFVW